MEDERGHRIETLRDEGLHQCRVCLELTEPGEPYLLGFYTPLARDSAYAETGPIFIHQKSCRPWDSLLTCPLPGAADSKDGSPLHLATPLLFLFSSLLASSQSEPAPTTRHDP